MAVKRFDRSRRVNSFISGRRRALCGLGCSTAQTSLESIAWTPFGIRPSRTCAISRSTNRASQLRKRRATPACRSTGSSSWPRTKIRSARRGARWPRCRRPSRARIFTPTAAASIYAQRSRETEFAPESIILGNGSNEIIEFIGHAFLRPGTELVTSENAFIAYRLVASLFGARAIEVADREHRFDLDAIRQAITPQTRVVFIANPNNPTGTLVRQEAIDRFMARVPNDVVVVFDEAYFEYLDDPPDTLRFVRENRNVIVLRTFSKIHALAGVRLGYGIAAPGTHPGGAKTRAPFNTNGVAQAGARAALADEAHQAESKRVTDEGRRYLEHEFAALGLPFVPSVANFVLVKVGDGKAVFKALLQHGVIVRALSGYKFPEWVRISVGTMEQNRKCIAALREVMAA